MLKAENEFSARRFLWRILWDEKYLKQQRTYFAIWLISPFNAIRCKTERNECVNLHNMRMSEVEWFEARKGWTCWRRRRRNCIASAWEKNDDDTISWNWKLSFNLYLLSFFILPFMHSCDSRDRLEKLQSAKSNMRTSRVRVDLNNRKKCNNNAI